VTDAPSQRHRHRASRLPAGLVLALIVVAVALALPLPRPDSPAPDQGPPRLGDVWPSAQAITLPSVLADGYLYQPLLVLDAATSVGLATSPDLLTARIVLRSGDAAPRDLRVLRGQQRPTVAAVSMAGDQLFWLETGEGNHGARETNVWRADLSTGQARRLATDASDVLYFDSEYDLQIADGQVRWAALATGGGSGGEIRSVPVNGGSVSVRRLDRLYGLTAWPWATTSANSQPGDVELLNLTTGERRTVDAGPNEILTCSPTWCRVTTLVNQGQSLTYEVEHVDGRDRRRIGDTALTPLNIDVALLDRFEVLASVASANAAGYAQRLWLHDLTTDRVVILDETANASVGSRGAYLWWSTGDNEALVWHVLDLRELA